MVGREHRNPALMHWQEGNRVSVTVFLCTPEEDRRFKIGFTTPLTYEKGRLSLRHVSFYGPATWRTDADIRVLFPHQEKLPEDLVLPRFWKTQGGGICYRDLYQPDWKLSFKAPSSIPKLLLTGKECAIGYQKSSLNPSPSGPKKLFWTSTKNGVGWNTSKYWIC